MCEVCNRWQYKKVYKQGYRLSSTMCLQMCSLTAIVVTPTQSNLCMNAATISLATLHVWLLFKGYCYPWCSLLLVFSNCCCIVPNIGALH